MADGEASMHITADAYLHKIVSFYRHVLLLAVLLLHFVIFFWRKNALKDKEGKECLVKEYLLLLHAPDKRR